MILKLFQFTFFSFVRITSHGRFEHQLNGPQSELLVTSTARLDKSWFHEKTKLIQGYSNLLASCCALI